MLEFKPLSLYVFRSTPCLLSHESPTSSFHIPCPGALLLFFILSPPLPVRCLSNTYLPDFSYFRKQISHWHLWEVFCPSCCNKTLNKSHLGGEGFALAYTLHLIIESSHNRSSQSLERGAKAKTIEEQGLLASFQPHGQVSFYYSPSPPYQR